MGDTGRSYQGDELNYRRLKDISAAMKKKGENMQEFLYTDELTAFMQIVLLGFSLSLPVCFTVENFKNTGCRDERFFFITAILISVIFGMGFAVTFTTMSLSESLWLCVFLWLSSQGFYEKLRSSDGILGKMFVSLSELRENEGTPEKEAVMEKEDTMIFPVNYIGITTPFSTFHPAVDFGYSSSDGGKNQPVIAPYDMKVVSCGTSTAIGKYIRAHAVYGGEKYTFRFIHLSEISVKENQEVKKGEIIGKMGNTGTECDGYHLHFDIWKGHVGDISSSSDRYKKSIDALTVCRLAKGQRVGDVTDRKYNIMRQEDE